MKYSNALIETLEVAHAFANNYGRDHLETWHLLTGFLVNPYSIVGSAFKDAPINLDLLEEKAGEIVGYPYRQLDEMTIFPFSPLMEKVFERGEALAQHLGEDELGTEHVFLVLLKERESLAIQLLYASGFDPEDKEESKKLHDLRKDIEARAGWSKDEIKSIRNFFRGSRPASQQMANMMGMPPTQSGGLEDYSRDLTAAARAGQLEPVVGREEEIDRMVHILSRKTKNNPVLVGDSGVGKTALALGLAQRIVDGQVPVALQDMRVMELDLMNVIAGTRFRGDFEERMNNIIDDIEKEGNIILFIDELHTIIGSGSGIDSTLDAANILKPALARGTLRTLGATTQEEYQKHIEKDAALVRRFAKVTIEEPKEADSLAILQGLRPRYEEHHQVTIEDEALKTAVQTAKRYLTAKRLPDSAIDLLDEAAATVQNRSLRSSEYDSNGLTELDRALMNEEFGKAKKLLKEAQKPVVFKHRVTSEDVLQTLSRLSGIPVQKLSNSEAKKYLNLEAELHKRVIGQDQAVSAISRAIRRNRSGLQTGKRPIGSFLFLGPTGVGKTELAKALAELLFDDEEALIRFDMSEYMEKFAASRLNGAPPGYVGYEEGGELTEKVRNRPYSVLLFDEVEKAHPDIFNLLLQVLDDGVLTDSRGRKVDFSNTLIIMTSNLGAAALRDDKVVGFGAGDLRFDHESMEKRMFEELKKAYRPEFLNRIDEKVVFHSLTAEQMQEIVKVMVKPMIAALAAKDVTLKFQPSALKLLAQKGYDPENGARPLRRTLQTLVEDPLSEYLLAGDLPPGSTMKVGVKAGQLKMDIQA